MSIRINSSTTSRSSLLSSLLQNDNEDDGLTMFHGRTSRNAGHRGRRHAEPFANEFDDGNGLSASAFANSFATSSALLPSLADAVAVPQGEQRWLRFDHRGNASYIEKVDKHALVTSLQLPARDLVMVKKEKAGFFRGGGSLGGGGKQQQRQA